MIAIFPATCHNRAVLEEIGPSLPGEAPHPDIQEILAKRREMLNRVRADLKKVAELQSEFWKATDKPEPKVE